MQRHERTNDMNEIDALRSAAMRAAEIRDFYDVMEEAQREEPLYSEAFERAKCAYLHETARIATILWICNANASPVEIVASARYLIRKY